MVGAWDQNMWDDITFGNLATAAPSIPHRLGPELLG
jgi:hypothetical protein